ncbi:hypothetical protein [Corallibacter sp.]|uniref:hypothetical protein n=1 Tax=Corallibacter sp. TaxID=2038084 RepID=UPI003AB53CCC
MAPIKFEEELKAKLEQRTIEPSSDAWESLAHKLDNQESNQNKKVFWWIGIAASVVGVLLVTTMFFNKPENQEVKVIDVNNVDVEAKSNGKYSIALEENETEIIEEVPIANKKNTDIVFTAPKKGTQQKEKNSQLDKQRNTISQQVQKRIANVNVTEIEETTTIKTNPETSLTPEALSVQEVVAQIQELKEEKNHVTDAEIDKLLEDAEKKIKKRKHDYYIKKTNKVDATALLQDVEEGIEQSFRDKVFEALKTGYDKVKTAVAERND